MIEYQTFTVTGIRKTSSGEYAIFKDKYGHDVWTSNYNCKIGDVVERVCKGDNITQVKVNGTIKWAKRT